MLTVLLLAAAVQDPPPRPATGADTLRPARLAELEVSVARGRDTLGRLPMAVGVVSAERLTLAQPGLGLDETLTAIPGVHVANRWNWSLDQRLSIRGAGSRANFGLRGVRVLLDGVPQTLPDGQSQLTNVDYTTLARVEVLRGGASALYGNASGGVLLLQSAPADPAPVRLGAGIEAGSFGSSRFRLFGSSRGSRLEGSWSASRFRTDGFRRHSRAELRQAAGAVTWRPDERTTLITRLALADTPESQNPGAITQAEAAADPTAASPNNVRRGADKAVAQQQLSVSLRRETGSGVLQAAVFGLRRDLENPLGAPAPGPPVANAGIYNRIDRQVIGGRVEGRWPLAGGRARLVGGAEVQRMRDERVNLRSLDGIATDSVLADQREVISELGPFVQLGWFPTARLSVLAGARLDALRFAVTDRHRTDGSDDGGTRSLVEPSLHTGLAWLGDGWTAHARVGTAFESPTSTELATTPTGAVGFNASLGPQRTLSVEAGARLTRSWGSLEATVFDNRIRDALVQASEQGGRAFFENAGRIHATGLELAGEWQTGSRWSLTGAWTVMAHRFDEYSRRSGSTVDTLDDRRVAGVPEQFARLGITVRPGRHLTVFVDHTMSGSLFADDANQLEVSGWGAGVTNLRAAGRLAAGGTEFRPFVAVMNIFDRSYIGAVTINGFGGRVLEPAPGRHLFVGLDVAWRRLGEREGG